MERGEFLLNALEAALKAGEKILEVYYSRDYNIELKEDKSPVTLADKLANVEITGILEKTLIPVLSEEGKDIPYEVRKTWEYFWLVDPLDGTKEFIKKSEEFTVNIALIHKNTPVMGIVYLPVHKKLYYSCELTGAFRFAGSVENLLENFSIDFLLSHSVKLPVCNGREEIVIMGSVSHPDPRTEEFIAKLKAKYNNVEVYTKGSSLKFCYAAEGGADIYPRFSPTMEWDTAAGHAIAQHAGLIIYSLEGLAPLVYNKANLVNPGFILFSSKFEKDICLFLSNLT